MMNEQQQRDNRGGPQSFISITLVNRWLNTLFETIVRMVTGQGSERAEEIAPRRGIGPSALGMRPMTPRRSIVGYINSGLYKVEQARRAAAMIRGYQNALRTIRLTRRAIRRAPRGSRHLFRGYNRVLGEARGRVKAIYKQMRHTEAHLRRYDPHALDEEIRRLERSLASASSPTSRAETEMILEARRDLLESILAIDDKLTALGTQLGTITAALELNHVRVVAISSRTGYSSQADLLQSRMQEVTEQLTLLEESLRELDAE